MKGNKTVVLKHLRENIGLTSMEAFKLYGITRLSAIIFDLRKLGYNIDTDMEIGKTRYGETCRYARYFLLKESENG